MRQAKTMMAVVKDKPGPGFAWKEVPCPEIGADQVLVQVKAVGICGTDIPILDGVRAVPEGLIPGHEFAGVITQVGSGVEGWAIGDRVAVGLVKGCGRCYYCKIGQESMCENILELGIHIHGAFTTFTAAPESCLHRLPDNLSFEEGAAVDPIASAYRGVRKAAVDVEDSVVIVGPGAIGLYALQTVKARGAHQVIVVGLPEDGPRLEVAEQLGADYVLTTQDGGQDGGQDGSVQDRVAQITGGRMASVVIEATGNPAAMPAVLSCAARQARVLLIGISHAEATFNPVIIVRRELQVIGSFCYSWEDFEESLWLLARGKITTRRMITHVMALEQMGNALELLHERKALKVILRP